MDEITTRFTCPARVDEIVNDISASLDTKRQDVDKKVSILTKGMREYDLQISRLMEAIKEGVPAVM